MTQEEEFVPPWDEDKISPGMYLWSVLVERCSPFQNTDQEKPYTSLDCLVQGGDQNGYKFSFRLYLHKKARGWTTYFLKKFGYPEEQLEAAQPTIKRSFIEGLRGKMLVEVSEDERFGFQINPKGFERPNETELEEELKKKEEAPMAGGEEAAIDLEADVKPDVSIFDREDPSAYKATDEDIPF